MFPSIRSGNGFSFIVKEIHIVKSKVIIEHLFRLGRYFEFDSVGCKFYSYILSLAKLIRIKTGIRVLILNFIINEKKYCLITKSHYSSPLLAIVYEYNQILNMSFDG